MERANCPPGPLQGIRVIDLTTVSYTASLPQAGPRPNHFRSGRLPQGKEPVSAHEDRARSIVAKISSSSGKRNCFSLENTRVPSIRTSKAPPLPSMRLDSMPYLSLMAVCKLAASGR